jgi:hypothetical protein
MPVLARLNQYASIQANEFDEVTTSTVRISGVGTFYSVEFNENVGVTTLTAGKFPAYNLIDAEFALPLYGPGQGTHMRRESNNTVTIYNEIDEVTPIP